jgi:hypothetical protein
MSMVTRRSFLAAVGVTALGAAAWATPRVGQAVPAFTVNDLTGVARTQRDLTGAWTVCFVMSDKDAGDAVSAWNRRMRVAAPGALGALALALGPRALLLGPRALLLRPLRARRQELSLRVDHRSQWLT